MPIYSSLDQTHPLASEYVKRLTPDAFAAQQVMAESLLGLSLPKLTDADVVERLEIALIQQVDFQVQQGMDGLILEAMGVGSQATKSMKWRDRYLNPMSARIVASLGLGAATSGWGDGLGTQSHRTNDGGGHSVRANGGIYRLPPYSR